MTRHLQGAGLSNYAGRSGGRLGKSCKRANKFVASLACLLAIATAVAGLAGLGSAWMLAFWLPSLVLTMLCLLTDGSWQRPLAVVREHSGHWTLHSLAPGERVTPASFGRCYVTPLLTTACMDDGTGVCNLAVTPWTLGPEQFRRLRMALRHPVSTSGQAGHAGN